MTPTSAPPSCITCGTIIARVETQIDPKNIAHRFFAQCKHEVDSDVAQHLWRDYGYRWDLPVIDGAGLIAAERRRQVDEEGYTQAHDAQHPDEGLPWGAWAYLDAAIHDTGATMVEPPAAWPWAPGEWKMEATPLRRLVIAAALIAAEIDRRVAMDRTA